MEETEFNSQKAQGFDEDLDIFPVDNDEDEEDEDDDDDDDDDELLRFS